VKQIGQDLGVRYVLEGSEQQYGNRVRVNAQLISAETGAHLWADKFDTDRADLLTMQDEIVARIARALDLEMRAVEAARIARTRPSSQDAQDLALRGLAGVNASTVASAEQKAAFDLGERALQIDGRNVIALNMTAICYAGRAITGLSADPRADIRQAEDLVARALALEPNSYGAHYAKSLVLLAQRRPEEALVEAERSVALNPSFIHPYIVICTASLVMGHPEKAIDIADWSIRISPRDPMLWSFYFNKGCAYAMLKDDAQAIDWLRRVVTLAPEFAEARRLLASELALIGQEPEARETLQRYLSLKTAQRKTIAQVAAYLKTLSNNPAFVAYADREIEGLRKAGMPQE